jgi:AraC-like DNA-binding protein
MWTWHYHSLHQLECALDGVAEVETESAHFLVPPAQAIWIPAGVEHCSTHTNVKAISVFFDPALCPHSSKQIEVLSLTPLLREMLAYGTRWPIYRLSSDPAADSFFTTMAYLVGERFDLEPRLCLPTTQHPVVAAAIEYTHAHLASVTLAEMCREVGISARTLRRLFVAETGMSWRRYTLESRLMRAMALLATDSSSVFAIALKIGFASESAFIRSFAEYTGNTPGAYRKRIHMVSALRKTPDISPHHQYSLPADDRLL